MTFFLENTCALKNNGEFASHNIKSLCPWAREVCPRKVGPWSKIFFGSWPRTLGPRLHLWYLDLSFDIDFL